MRVLTFRKAEQEVYNILMAALYNDPRDHKRASIVKMAKLQGVVESIAMREESVNAEGSSTVRWVLRDETVTLVLEEDEFDQLKGTMEVIPWRSVAAQRVVAAFDFLDTAKHVTAKELAQGKGEDACNTPEIME